MSGEKKTQVKFGCMVSEISECRKENEDDVQACDETEKLVMEENRIIYVLKCNETEIRVQKRDEDEIQAHDELIKIEFRKVAHEGRSE